MCIAVEVQGKSTAESSQSINGINMDQGHHIPLAPCSFSESLEERYNSAVGNHWQRQQSEPWLNSYQPSDLFLSAMVQDQNTSDKKQAV